MTITGDQSNIITLLKKAGQEIVSIENKGFTITTKTDDSPVTEADFRSDMIIRQGLSLLYPNINIVSEEYDENKSNKHNKFWLLDPLDGTKEFIKGNGEYCISLALIENGRPIAAYIHKPVSNITWYAYTGKGAFLVQDKRSQKLPLQQKEQKTYLTLLRSRSHHGKEETSWLDRVSEYEKIESVEQGSAIKFGRIASGEADLYVKKARIFGWDIAAGDLILKESGGGIISFDTRKEIHYNTEGLKMPHFLAYGSRINNPEDYI